MVTIAVDAMGGDFGPRVTVPAVLSVLSHHPQLQILLFGDRAKIDPVLDQYDACSRLQLVHTEQSVSCADSVSNSLRKRESSMRLALDAVHDGKASAMVSAGNTGALVANSRYVLKTLLGIDRPALIASIPNAKGHSYLMDLGANLESDSDNLCQFAIMGSAFAEAMDGQTNPKVALLNIGSEEVKGNEEIRLANAHLKHSEAIDYIGYVEGDDLFSGVADVVVANGFTGNVALKTSEGLLLYVVQMIRTVFEKNWYGRIIGALALPMLEKLQKEFEPELKNGGVLLGVQGVVVKSHGKADDYAFQRAIEKALILHERALLDKVSHRIEQDVI